MEAHLIFFKGYIFFQNERIYIALFLKFKIFICHNKGRLDPLKSIKLFTLDYVNEAK